ncbi:MBL fold metallo-hydrolase [Promethearchaeum syntrophicum]|uniref:MBL fold metallo-hydrolase n=1 Tax=Promethearchaeum syntrophicum TaxID=2594042 RepID=A0A5B9D916_9ARCH|nr:MBL fold metallo-hydrolase [Candidatus Prometheoarchaeum syntrophicum]QEE15768.1 hydroxyacylglutathione hydrolase [Candidatus Prometheoarchaeum syntrophicum]
MSKKKRTRNNYIFDDIPENLTIIDLVDVNCYLLKNKIGYILIDSGMPKNRAEVEKRIIQAGCNYGDLKIILLTHGDFDHTGTCAYLRTKFDSKIAMHFDDSGMVEFGDFSWNRNIGFLMKILGKMMIKIYGLSLKEKDRFKPDIYIRDGQSLTDFGFNATVYSIPGHSKGSIGFLDTEGNFFCGDLLMNKDKPAKFEMIVNSDDFENSIKNLRTLDIKVVYPGHGKPFLIKNFFDLYCK